ncbi:receptor-like tyrosine-protein kinase kin-16 isoform X2 [Leptopilina boulardi]|uniref:receptor-like tyrosine-protein kinase kin-16 isoform X2 n=1 Tax=Leptopilina boulardi TaxID=63433 RepID=UPI0021F6498C|nr:receptor-like tyrosine-protein kinase kin-16 isoform X2 [Leptopilina boulardi]
MIPLKYCELIFYTLFVIFNGHNVKCYQNKSITVGIVRNLSVTVFQDREFNNSDILKFNISWLPPVNDKKSPTSYSILISSILNNEETENKTSCPKESLYYTTKNKNELQVSLPKRTFLTEISEFNIHLKCTYNIQIFANPRTHSLQTASKIFTVPDCVGLTCSCQKLKKLFPDIQIQTKFLFNGDILIKWKLNSTDSRISAYIISIGLPILVSKNNIPVFKKSKIFQLPASNFSFLWKKDENIIYNVSSETIVFVSAIDERGCQGNEASTKVQFFEEENTNENIILTLLGIIFFIIAVIGILISLYFRRRKGYNATFFDKGLPRNRIDLILQNHNILYVNQETDEVNKKKKMLSHENYEINFKNVELKKELGRGQFGRVYLAYLQDKKIQVAVKMSTSDVIYEEDAKKQLLEEIEIIKAAGSHPNLVSLVGYCLSLKNPICLILEYMEKGDLLSYLYSLRDKDIDFEIKYSNISNSKSNTTIFDFGEQTLPLLYKENNYNKEQNYEIKSKTKFVERKQFLCFALQIALGMEHLESKTIIHRDLAARNILIDYNFNLKISDFGLSRNGIYVMGNGIGGVRRLPIRWMSPETLRERAFSSKSDVWSFAVVLWEIGTLGMFPYSSIQDDDLLKYILSDKGRLSKPENVDNDIYNLMNICWFSAPERRPSFGDLVTLFNSLSTQNCSLDNFSQNNPCYSLLTSNQN